MNNVRLVSIEHYLHKSEEFRLVNLSKSHMDWFSPLHASSFALQHICNMKRTHFDVYNLYSSSKSEILLLFSMWFWFFPLWDSYFAIIHIEWNALLLLIKRTSWNDELVFDSHFIWIRHPIRYQSYWKMREKVHWTWTYVDSTVNIQWMVSKLASVCDHSSYFCNIHTQIVYYRFYFPFTWHYVIVQWSLICIMCHNFLEDSVV